MKYFCFLLYSRHGYGVPMVTKLVLEIHPLCNKNEISYVNPFLSAHIPYAQSEGILPKYGLLQ